MNTERLHAVAQQVTADLSATQLKERITKVEHQLQAVLQNPTQRANHLPKLHSQWTALEDQLEGSSSASYPGSWIRILEELRVDDLLGHKLKERLKLIREGNHIESHATLTELTRIRERITNLQADFSRLISSFDHLRIAPEGLSPGECLLGYTVPRALVSNELRPLSRELQDISRVLDVFGELATGQTPSVLIRTISSSDFTILLSIDPATLACFAVALNSLLRSYERVSNIRLLHKRLKKEALSEDVLSRINEEADGGLKKEIAELVETLKDRYGRTKKKGRDNELEAALAEALKVLGRKIDAGVTLEIRFNRPGTALPANGPDDSTSTAAKTAFETLAEVAPGLPALEQRVKEILSLPAPNERNGASDNGSE